MLHNIGNINLSGCRLGLCVYVILQEKNIEFNIGYKFLNWLRGYDEVRLCKQCKRDINQVL